jgi:hypothetical protein
VGGCFSLSLGGSSVYVCPSFLACLFFFLSPPDLRRCANVCSDPRGVASVFGGGGGVCVRAQVLIFSQMVRMLDLLEEFCEARRYHCERLDGRVAGKERLKAMDRFNKLDPDRFCILLDAPPAVARALQRPKKERGSFYLIMVGAFSLPRPCGRTPRGTPRRTAPPHRTQLRVPALDARGRRGHQFGGGGHGGHFRQRLEPAERRAGHGALPPNRPEKTGRPERSGRSTHRGVARRSDRSSPDDPLVFLHTGS